MHYDIILQHLIEQEQAKREYCVTVEDRKRLDAMLLEINNITDAGVHYLAELDFFSIKGAGNIVKDYIFRYESESIRSYLLHFLVNDQVRDCDKIVYQLYLHFKGSKCYIPLPDQPGSLAIYMRYDNAFKRLKPKKIKAELQSLAYNPRDAFYLPLTMCMLASWKLPDLEALFVSYMESKNITPESVGLSDCSENYHPSLFFIRRELKFTAIECLKYYPSMSTFELIKGCSADHDKDISMAAQKTLKYME